MTPRDASKWLHVLAQNAGLSAADSKKLEDATRSMEWALDVLDIAAENSSIAVVSVDAIDMAVHQRRVNLTKSQRLRGWTHHAAPPPPPPRTSDDF